MIEPEMFGSGTTNSGSSNSGVASFGGMGPGKNGSGISKADVQKRRYQLTTQGPFHTANNLHLFYGGGDRSAIGDGIAERLRRSSEPIVVSGEAGSGKTMMSLVLADRFQRHYNVIRYEHPQVDSTSLLRHLLIEISPQAAVALSRNILENLEPSVQRAAPTEGAVSAGISSLEDSRADSDSDLAGGVDQDAHLLESMFTSIRSTLEQGTPNNKPVLLILDAQETPDQQCLNLLYRLTQTANRFGRVFSVVLFLNCETALACSNRHPNLSSTGAGTSEVPAGKVKKSTAELRPDFQLRRLSLAEVTEYLQHHMLLFDFNKRDLFNRDMAYFIADRTMGNFKAINVLARNAFMLASLEEAQQMSMSHLLMAGLPQRPEKKRRWFQGGRKARRVCVGLLVMSFAALAGAGVLHFF